MRKLFTSESVTEGHPDKLCDQVSDAVLDALLAQDPMSRVACETCATTGMVMVMGEITTMAKVDIPAIVRDVVLDIGYNDSSLCFDGNTCAVLTSIHAQSPDIAMGVDDALETRTQDANEIGAGDQGMMFGFACDETPEYMPTAIAFAHRLTRRLTEVRKNGTLPWLRPDGKAQVTIAYEDGQPVAVDTIVISTQHNPEVTHADIYAAMMEHVIRPVIPAEMLTADTRYLINPTGRFVIGGPAGDSGLTGRKIIVDTYGGYAPHGGGAFSGKDPTKVDRSAAYAARHIEEHRRGGAGEALRNSAGVCHWRRAPGEPVHRHNGHGRCFGRQAGGSGGQAVRPASERHHSAAEPAPPDLPRELQLRSFRQGGHAVGAAGLCQCAAA